MKQRFAPYRHERFGLQMQALRCQLDDARAIAPFDLEQHFADLVEHRFKEVSIRYSVKVPTKVIAAVFPEAERPNPPAKLILAIRCAKTRLRQAVLVSDKPKGGESLEATVTLKRELVRGSVEVAAFLVRSKQSRANARGFANTAGVQVASARPWEIRIDLQRPSAGNYLEIEYVSFKEHGPPQFQWPENLYKLDSTTSMPRLWLNEDHPHIVEILNSKGTIGVRARIRELIFDSISASVWTRLFLKAAEDLRGGDEVPFEWEDAVLDMFLPGLYPSSKRRSRQIEELRDELEAGDIAQVIDRLDELLQQRHELAKHANKLIVEGAKAVEMKD